MSELESELAQAPVFAGLSPAHLAVIAGCGREQHVPSGTVLLREGGTADTFYLIRTGAAALEVQSPAHGPLLIETLHDHDVVGWSWLFAPYRWQMDGRTTRECALVAFDAACLRGECDADHELGYELMRRFAASIVDRLQATRLQLLDVYGRAPASA
ncbi:MAG TPA: cyclic nucleotide-binding domain-containing protein [Solirubrobacteraceae bacterium]